MPPFDQVDHLVDYYVLQARHGLFGQLRIQPDPSDFGVAGTPSRLHPPDAPINHRDPDPGFPLRDHLWDAVPELGPVPPIQHGLTSVPLGVGAHPHLHPGLVAKTNPSGAGRLDHIQPVAPPLEVVALTRHELASRLAILSLELCPLSANPGQPRDDGEPHRVVIQAKRRGDAHPPLRGIDAQVQVLDVLADDLDLNTADLDAGAFSTHVAPSQSRAS